jgi:hypothetical protein
MKYVKLYYGLPRINEQLLIKSCLQLDLQKGEEVENIFYLWDSDEKDDREKVISNGDIENYENNLKNIKNNFFVNNNKIIQKYKKEIDDYLSKINVKIKLPDENKNRPDNFKINIRNTISHCVARAGIGREIIKSNYIEQDVLYILTRTDLILSNNVNLKKISDIIGNKKLIITPCSGWHGGGVTDQILFFKKEFINAIIELPNYLINKINNNEELMFEKIFRKFIEEKDFEVKSIDRIALILRNGRLKHSGIDGIIEPDFLNIT